jgi:hypothetical protein
VDSISPLVLTGNVSQIKDPSIVHELDRSRITIRATMAWIAASSLATCMVADIEASSLTDELRDLIPADLLVETAFDVHYKETMLGFLVSMTNSLSKIKT